VHVSVIAAFVWAAIVIANAILLASIIVGIIGNEQGIPKKIFALACLWIFRSVFQSRFDYWCSVKASAIKEQMRSEITSDISAFTQTSPTKLSTLLIKGLNSLDIYLGRFIPQTFFSMVLPLLVIVTIAVIDPLSAVIAVVTLPLIPFFGALIGKFTAESVNKKWQSLGTLSNYFEDSLRGFVTLKIFGRSQSQSQRIQKMGDDYTSETMKVLRISFLSAFALELCATISVALIAVVVGLRLVDDTIAFKSALTVLILAPEVYFPLRNAAALFHASADGAQAVKEIDALKKRELIHNSGEIKVGKDFLGWQEWNCEISEFVRARLSPAELHRGDTLFIVGESGSGKSTFALKVINSLLESSINPTIGYIPQIPHLASGNIREQFILLKKNADDAFIIEMLREVGLHMVDLSDGLETLIGGAGESTSELSGGQIRKIAVARALFHAPDFIIADEPTADLDSESARLVMSALRKRSFEGCISLFVTHDLSQVEEQEKTLQMMRVDQ
jgi:ABC-type transport system involved in cytochrome bd biosynthesis fused ATPase/permease subunit